MTKMNFYCYLLTNCTKKTIPPTFLFARETKVPFFPLILIGNRLLLAKKKKKWDFSIFGARYDDRFPPAVLEKKIFLSPFLEKKRA